MDTGNKPTLLHRRESADQQTLVTVGPAVFGGTDVVMVAGPCAVESEEQLETVAQMLSQLGIPCLRGGAYKPRTSPYNYQGMGEPGLVLMAEVAKRHGLSVISEVMSTEQIAIAEPYVDCYQVGSRNMQNFELLKALGQTQKPVLLKRGLASTIEEFLLAAEYILAGGNPNVILCERGIRSFDPMTRNVLDLASVALLKELTHLPVVVDPSHATGKRSLIAATAKAAIAVGADAVMVEAHPNPEASISDAAQALSLPMLAEMMPDLAAVAMAIGRGLAYPNPLQSTESAMASVCRMNQVSQSAVVASGVA
jgi:3-deoxy-7-phosphoheptulonate synthase